MKFTVTPLGGARTDTAQVVASIIRYLQPVLPSPAVDGDDDTARAPDRYYADGAEEPGRWLGRTARTFGLDGPVGRNDFASMLAGRHPATGERLITAQGSAGRRATLGTGAHTRVAADGEELFGVGDIAAALGLTHAEAERLLAAGAALSTAKPGAAAEGGPPAPFPAAATSSPGIGDHPDGSDWDAEHPDSVPGPHATHEGFAPGGSYLGSIVDDAGERWVRRSELERCIDDRNAGTDPEHIRSLGNATDQLSLAEAARLAGVTARYLRGLARYHDEHRVEIDQASNAGRAPRRAYLAAHRGTRGRWLVTRERLAQFLERRRPPAVRVAYDLTLTTEKSLGVLALLSDTDTRNAVLAAIQAGNDWAMNWIGDRAVGRVDGQPVPAEGLAVASFRHLTSRALDPFPHHHNVVINTARMPDGHHRGLWSRPLYADAHAASALATAEMRRRLTHDLGVQWRPGRSSGWEINGISDHVVREFSQRRTEIDDALRELETEIGRGAHPNEIEHIVLRTRPPKNHTPADQLVESWRQHAAAHDLDTDTIATLTGHHHDDQHVDPDAVFAALTAPDGICANGSVFTRSDALTALANLAIPTTQGPPQPFLGGADTLIELTETFLASTHVRRLNADSTDALFTTAEMLEIQQRIANRFAAGLHTGAHIVGDPHLDVAFDCHPHLTSEQRHLATQWCQYGHRFQTAIGRAGAGKTTTVAACADAWTAAGYRVVGAAVKGEATRTLAATTGIETETVAWYLAHNDPANLPLDARTILVVDEASTLSDRDLDALMNMAATTGASLRLIGDPAQHGAITAGGMFRVLCERHPNHTPELATTHRLQNPHDRAAAEALRDGRIDDAFNHLTKAGHLHIVGDDLTMYRHILGRWWNAHLNGLDHPMVDRRNTTRRQLNRLAHLLRAVNGELDGEPISASGGRSFAIGDRVTARAPNRELHVTGNRRAYIRNGALGTITAIRQDGDPKHDTLTIDFDGIGTIDVPRWFFDRHHSAGGRTDVGLDHAYALTSYAVQGSTRDVSTSRVDSTATRAETYVDITRGRHANHLYLTTAADPLDGETLPRIPPEPADIAVAERLRRSTSELTAWELAHPPQQPTSPAAGVAI